MKPCKMCGNEPMIEESDIKKGEHMVSCSSVPKSDYRHYMSVIGDTKEIAIKMWDFLNNQ